MSVCLRQLGSREADSLTRPNLAARDLQSEMAYTKFSVVVLSSVIILIVYVDKNEGFGEILTSIYIR